MMVFAAIVLTALYLSYGTMFYGTRNSLSRLAVDWNKWLFMLYMWTQTVLVVPGMFDATPEHLQWIIFFVAAGLALTGGAAIDNRDDLRYHCAGAVVACVATVAWLAIVEPILLLIPALAICAGGYDRLQWCGEIGLIIAVYIQLIL